ncbi:MAG: HIT family protein [Candidatus Woesearchaeota archaeon]
MKNVSNTKKDKCIFCDLAHGNIKFNGTFWEDKKYLAFLSGQPNTEGFTVIIPKKHYGSDVLEMPEKELKEFITTAKKVSKILLKYFKDTGRIGLIMEGTGVDHAHIKLIPMHGTEHMKKGIWKEYVGTRVDYFKKYEGFIASTNGPRENPEKIIALAKKLNKIKI